MGRVMFFLLRMAFWLTVVCVLLPSGSNAPSPETNIDATQAASLATAAVFVQTLQRALRYRITQWQTLQRIAWFCLSQGDERLPYVDVDESFRERPAYQEGSLTDEPDLSRYDPPEPDDDTDPPETEQADG